MGGRTLEQSDLEDGQFVGSCEYGNKGTGFTK